jgi:hypothetical protein
MMINKMDFISSMEGLVYTAIGIAACSGGLAVYLILPKDNGNRQKRIAPKSSKQMNR